MFEWGSNEKTIASWELYDPVVFSGMTHRLRSDCRHKRHKSDYSACVWLKSKMFFHNGVSSTNNKESVSSSYYYFLQCWFWVTYICYSYIGIHTDVTYLFELSLAAKVFLKTHWEELWFKVSLNSWNFELNLFLWSHSRHDPTAPGSDYASTLASEQK